jgi:hypothetical protein
MSESSEIDSYRDRFLGEVLARLASRDIRLSDSEEEELGTILRRGIENALDEYPADWIDRFFPSIDKLIARIEAWEVRRRFRKGKDRLRRLWGRELPDESLQAGICPLWPFC